MSSYLGINVDYSRDSLFDELGLKRLKESYMRDEETSPQQRFAFVSKQFSSNQDHAQRLYDYASKHWLSYSTPILSFGRTKYGLPISCFLSWIPDTAKGLVDTLSETNWLSMLGGGVGLGFGIRSAGDKSTGVMPHLKIYDASSLAFKQGNCYVPGTEILTSSGWKPIELLAKNDDVAVIDDDGGICFEKPLEIVSEKYNGNIIKFYNKTRGIEISVTEDHSMVVERKVKSGWSKKLEKVRASELKFHNEVRFWNAAKKSRSQSKLDALTRLKIAIQADAHIRADGVCEFHLKKERKISRITEILSNLDLETWQANNLDGTVRVYAKGMNFDGLKSLSWIDLSRITQEDASAMLEEIAEWDATRNRQHSFIYFSTIKENASIVQALSVIAGRQSRIFHRKRDKPRQDMYTVFVGSKNYFLLEKLRKEHIQYEGMVHCCVVRTGKIVVRAGETPIVCGNTRRGSYAAYLDISHPDVPIFLEMRKPTGDQNMRCLNLHHGINISDSFMKIIERSMIDPNADDSWELKEPHTGQVKEVVSAKELWQKILELRMQTGEPYIHFIDTSNRFLPDFLKSKGLQVRQSNLCVSGDQRVPTNFGMLTAKELYDLGEDLVLASNDGPVKSTKMNLIERNAETFKVTLDNGMTHTVTGYHKILAKKNGKVEAIALSELNIGDDIFIQSHEGVFGTQNNIEKVREYFSENHSIENMMVPNWLWNSDKATHIAYIGRIILSSFTSIDFDKSIFVSKVSIRSFKEDAASLQLILSNFGVTSNIDDDTNSVCISEYSSIYKINHIVGSPYVANDKFENNSEKSSKITKIEPAGKQDVYCVGVHTDQHLWVCNGVITHNCSEIILPTSDERTAVCCLSSLNLETYDQWKDDPLFLKDVAEMLDNVLTYFIENAPESISRAKFSAMRERSIGIGALGFHAYLQQKGIPFESALAKSTNIRMFKQIRGLLDIADLELGKERGEAPDAVGTGKRFSHILAIAPNACVTSDTKIISSDGESISFDDIGAKLGVDMKSFEYLTVDFDDGTSKEIHIGQSLKVSRDGSEISIIASELIENDEIILIN